MNVFRLCSPVIAAAVIGVVLSAPAVFARPENASVLDHDRCAPISTNASANAPSSAACLDANEGTGHESRPQ